METEMTRPVRGERAPTFPRTQRAICTSRGQTVSVIGDALSAVPRPRLILSNGDNAKDLGIVLTAYSGWRKY
jgi:hypothetical protein